MTRPGSTDAYYRRAKSQGYAARSVFKLQEMDRRYGLLRSGQAVLDLGCHPGSWLQFASKKVGRSGRLVGVDLQEPSVSIAPGVLLHPGRSVGANPGPGAAALGHAGV